MAHIIEITDFSAPEGQGLTARLNGEVIWGGNARLAAAMHCDISVLSAAAEELAAKGRTPLYFGIGSTPLGLISVADPPRETSAAAIAALRQMGLSVLLLTGDHRRTAEAIAAEVGIPRVIPEVLPQQKEAVIRSLQQKGEVVAMVGDGINDAPALKRAHVGIAMGGVGSDIAVDAADIALVNDDIRELPHLLALSKRMMRTIKSNLAFSMTLNFIAIALAITGILNPVVGALVHNAGSVLVIVNSSLLLKWRKRP